MQSVGVAAQEYDLTYFTYEYLFPKIFSNPRRLQRVGHCVRPKLHVCMCRWTISINSLVTTELASLYGGESARALDVSATAVVDVDGYKEYTPRTQSCIIVLVAGWSVDRARFPQS